MLREVIADMRAESLPGESAPRADLPRDAESLALESDQLARRMTSLEKRFTAQEEKLGGTLDRILRRLEEG